MAKLQDEETDKVYYTNVACELFNADTCRCQDYKNRSNKVPDCLTLSLERQSEFEWLPSTCAYKLRLNSQPLPNWHPLRSNDSESTHNADVSVKGKTIKLSEAGDLEHHLVDWG